MNGEMLFGAIITALVGFGCGGLFYGIGIFADRSKRPIAFYAGTTVDPATIWDVPAYNRACGRMWKCYSIPYLLCGILGILILWWEQASIAVLILMLIASLPGSGWLIWKWERIHRKFQY